MDKLSEAIANWIRAEYQYRLGPCAYHKPTDEWMIEAQEDLREALTGHRELDAAAEELGVELPEKFTKGRKGTPNIAHPAGSASPRRERVKFEAESCFGTTPADDDPMAKEDVIRNDRQSTPTKPREVAPRESEVDDDPEGYSFKVPPRPPEKKKQMRGLF